jgi:hypothetical protein
MAALVGLLALGARGHLPLHATFGTLAGMTGGDYIDSGVRIVPPAPTSLMPDGGDQGDGMSKTDLEGDEVSPALATYGIDGEGNLFEVHSPHTEVPRLAGPTI